MKETSRKNWRKTATNPGSVYWWLWGAANYHMWGCMDTCSQSVSSLLSFYQSTNLQQPLQLSAPPKKKIRRRRKWNELLLCCCSECTVLWYWPHLVTKPWGGRRMPWAAKWSLTVSGAWIDEQPPVPFTFSSLQLVDEFIPVSCSTAREENDSCHRK